MLFHISKQWKIISTRKISKQTRRKISVNFSFDHVNEIFDRCKCNVSSSSSSSKTVNEDGGKV
jgi:hypothetical protein